MQSEFSFKELYDVMITAPYDINIGNRLVKSGEIIALFDKLIISNFDEVQSIKKAKGGYNDGTLIIWQDTKELNFSFSQGVFNKEQLALLNNANLLEYTDEPFIIKNREFITLDDDGNATVKYNLANTQFFVYTTNGKVEFETTPTVIGNKIFLDLEPNEEVIIDYSFDYNINKNKHITNIQIGDKLINGNLILEAKTKIQEDGSGLPKTALIRIPKFRLLSNFSIRLGAQSQPVVGSMRGIGLPIGERGEEKVMELIFLEDDIDADM